MADEERPYMTFSTIACSAIQLDHIYSPTQFYSNLADRIFMFGPSYQKILPVKSNASMSHIRSEKGNGVYLVYSGSCRCALIMVLIGLIGSLQCGFDWSDAQHGSTLRDT